MVGAGAFGLAAAWELAQRGFELVIVDPTGPTPHSLAASRDISKVVRSEYGGDLTYTRMAQKSIDQWIQLNERWGQVYHNTGIAWLSSDSAAAEFESLTLKTAGRINIELEILGATEIKERWPMFNQELFQRGIFNPRGGFVEARRALEHLRDELHHFKVEWHIGKSVANLSLAKGRCLGVVLADGVRLEAEHVLVAAGAWTGLLVPLVSRLASVTAQPIFHLLIEDWKRYSSPRFSVAFLDTETTGVYAMPLHPEEKVIKVGLHTQGRDAHPQLSDRIVQEQEITHLRCQLKRCAPELSECPIVYSRVCLYHDTLDFDFVIDRHPEIENLTVACGGSGHGFKFTPLLGEIVADRVENIQHPFAKKFKWREQANPDESGSMARPSLGFSKVGQ